MYFMCMIPIYSMLLSSKRLVLSEERYRCTRLISAARRAKALTQLRPEPPPLASAMAEFEVGSSTRPSTPPRKAGASTLDLTPEQIKRIEINRLKGTYANTPERLGLIVSQLRLSKGSVSRVCQPQPTSMATTNDPSRSSLLRRARRPRQSRRRSSGVTRAWESTSTMTSRRWSTPKVDSS